MGTQFLPLRQALFGGLLALAVVICVVFPAWKAEALFWSYHHFDRQVPEAVSAIIDDQLKDELAAAKLAFPDFNLQMLTSDIFISNMDIYQELSRFAVLIAGSPYFCNADGCTLYYFERNEEGEWSVSWKLPSNGFLIRTDLGYDHIETRGGCQFLRWSAKAVEEVEPFSCSVFHASNWRYKESSDQEKMEGMIRLVKLKKFVFEAGIETENERKASVSYSFRIKNADLEVRITQLKAFCAERYLTCASWGDVSELQGSKKDENLFRVILFPHFNQYFYQDRADYIVDWVTE